MTRQKELTIAVNEITLKCIKNNMPEPYKICIERCDKDMPTFIVERLVNVPQTKECEYLSNYTKCLKKHCESVIYINKWDVILDRWVTIRHYYVKNK